MLVANHIKACQLLIERAVTGLATESGRARSKRSAICSGSAAFQSTRELVITSSLAVK